MIYFFLLVQRPSLCLERFTFRTSGVCPKLFGFTKCKAAILSRDDWNAGGDRITFKRREKPPQKKTNKQTKTQPTPKEKEDEKKEKSKTNAQRKRKKKERKKNERRKKRKTELKQQQQQQQKRKSAQTKRAKTTRAACIFYSKLFQEHRQRARCGALYINLWRFGFSLCLSLWLACCKLVFVSSKAHVDLVEEMDTRDHLMQLHREGRGGRIRWKERGKGGFCFVGCLTPHQNASVYLRDGSAQTILRAATLR